jgi:hypothetical protein
MFATPRECKVVASRPSRPLETAGETLWLYLHEGRKPDFWRYASNDRIPGWSRRLSSIPFTIASGYGGRPQDSNCFRSEIHSRAKIHMSHMGGCLVSNRTSRAHTAQHLGELFTGDEVTDQVQLSALKRVRVLECQPGELTDVLARDIGDLHVVRGHACEDSILHG